MSDLNEQLKTWPAEIWLNTGDDETLAAFDEYAEVSWCSLPQGPADVRYVREDRAPAAAPAPTDKEMRHAQHIVAEARKLGWDENGDEGAWEFVTRSAYQTGWDDRRPAAPAPVAASDKEKFEAWAKSKGWSLAPAREGTADTYMDTDTEIAWYGYCAALAAAPAAAPIVQPVAMVRIKGLNITTVACTDKGIPDGNYRLYDCEVPVPASSTAAAKDAALDIAVKALESIDSWRFGWDGDCGVQRVSSEALEKIAEARAAITSSAGEVKPNKRDGE